MNSDLLSKGSILTFTKPKATNEQAAANSTSTPPKKAKRTLGFSKSPSMTLR